MILKLTLDQHFGGREQSGGIALLVAIGELVDERVIGVDHEPACRRIVAKGGGVRPVLLERGSIERRLRHRAFTGFQPSGAIVLRHPRRGLDVEGIRADLHRVAHASEERFGYVNTRRLRQELRNVQFFILTSLPRVVGRPARVEDAAQVVAEPPDVIRIPDALAGRKQVVPQPVGVDLQSEAGPRGVVEGLQAEQLVLQVDDASPHADEEPVAASDVPGPAGLELLFVDARLAADLSDPRQAHATVGTRDAVEGVGGRIAGAAKHDRLDLRIVLLARPHGFAIELDPEIRVERQAGAQDPAQPAGGELAVQFLEVGQCHGRPGWTFPLLVEHEVPCLAIAFLDLGEE